MYEERNYRNLVKSRDLINFQTIVQETDLFISAEKNLRKAASASIRKYRQQIRDYINIDPEFQKILRPYMVADTSPQIVREMARASAIAGVGPFASVAGAIAEFVGGDLLKFSSQLIVENGGDIFIKSNRNRLIGIFAGKSALSNQLAIDIPGSETSLGICTSSGTVGHSLSYGKADAVVIISDSTLIADAVATATGNLIQSPHDIEKGIEFARKIKAIKGIVIIIDNKIGVWGDITLVKTEQLDR